MSVFFCRHFKKISGGIQKKNQKLKWLNLLFLGPIFDLIVRHLRQEIILEIDRSQSRPDTFQRLQPIFCQTPLILQSTDLLTSAPILLSTLSDLSPPITWRFPNLLRRETAHLAQIIILAIGSEVKSSSSSCI